MEFKLTSEIREQLIYAMENQTRDFCFDSEKGILAPIPDGVELDSPDNHRYMPIPRWTSADGFRLMEKFVSSLRNPIFRENLKESLTAGKGVFRKFKNTLKGRPDMEKLWYTFKEKDMRQRVYEWYNQFCDLWGTERLAEEVEETEDLILSDFTLRIENDSREEYFEYDRSSFFEALAEEHGDYVQYRYQHRFERLKTGKDLIIRAENPDGELAGFIWGKLLSGEEGDEPTFSVVYQWHVLESFRGLGLSTLLVEKYCREAWDAGLSYLYIELAGTAFELGKKLEAVGFEHLFQIMELSLDKWGRQNNLVDDENKYSS